MVNAEEDFYQSKQWKGLKGALDYSPLLPKPHAPTFLSGLAYSRHFV